MPATNVLEKLEAQYPDRVIFSEQKGKRPDYPYIAVKVLVDNISNGNHPTIINAELLEDIEQTAIRQLTMSMSITAYGIKFDETTNLIKKVHDWFSFVGNKELKRMGLVVESVESIMNRDSLIVDDYERRRGFDVILRYVQKSKRITESLQSADLYFKRIEDRLE